MKKYRVLRDCHWNFGYWEEGQKVEFSDELTPPEHFQLIDRFGDDIVLPPEPTDQSPKTFSEINKERANAMPKVGMAAKSRIPAQPQAI